MQLFKSLFCLVGRDNGFRFASIQLLTYLVCVILIVLMNDAVIPNVVMLFLVLPVIGLSSLRRIRDAGLRIALSLIPGILFLLVMLTIVLVQHSLAYWLLCLSLSTVGIFAMVATKKTNGQKYILGYSGPIDLSELLVDRAKQHMNNRVEPSFAGAAHAAAEVGDVSFDDDLSAKNTQQLKNQWVDWFTHNAKYVYLSFASLVLIILLFTWLSMTPNKSEPADSGEQVKKTVQTIESVKPDALFNQVTMNDDFYVATNQYNGLIISWDVSGSASGEVWSIITAKGKPGCDAIRFDKGDDFRTLSVKVENGTYYAQFSPMDSMAVVRALAFRNKFALCDFDFSLKGSQKQLSSVETYANWLAR